jgi:hypothetical protein
MKNNLPWNYLYTITPDVVDETEAANNPSVTYLGFWDNGPLDQNRYQIRRVTTQNSITITEYAEGNELFNKDWSQRAVYNYSLLK